MIQLYLMGVIYSILGVVHFTHTGFYRPFMPKFLPAHDLLIYLSGVAEILLGIGVLFPQTRILALWGLIAMLIVFLIVHVNMLFPNIPSHDHNPFAAEALKSLSGKNIGKWKIKKKTTLKSIDKQ